MQTYFDSINIQVGQKFDIPNPVEAEFSMLATHARGIHLICYSDSPVQDMTIFYQPLRVYGFTFQMVPYIGLSFGTGAFALRLVFSFNPYGMDEERFHSWRQDESGCEVNVLLVNRATGVLLGARTLSLALGNAVLSVLKREAAAAFLSFYDGEAIVDSVNELMNRPDWPELIAGIESNSPVKTDIIVPKISLN